MHQAFRYRADLLNSIRYSGSLGIPIGSKDFWNSTRTAGGVTPMIYLLLRPCIPVQGGVNLVLQKLEFLGRVNRKAVPAPQFQ